MTNKTEDIQKALLATTAKYLHKTFSHYKGGVYKIVGVYFDSVSDEPAVLYERVDGMHFNQFAEAGIQFGRPVSQIEEKINGQPRFVRVIQEKQWVAI